MPTSRSSVYDFDAALTETRLTSYGEYRPFRAREAFLLSRRLGRPLTESEMRQFEYTAEDDSNDGTVQTVEISNSTYANTRAGMQVRGAVLV